VVVIGRGAALASEASGQRGNSMMRAHSASEDARERAGDTRPEPGSSARAALKAQPDARPAVIFLPRANAMWRVQLRQPGNNESIIVTVDDRSGAVERQGDPLAGDRAAQWMRWIHEGSHSGAIWQAIVFLTGVFPLVFVVTGVVMWWRGRRGRRLLAEGRAAEVGELQAAE
jgi:uncharacterized iron-regulated membrane protein